jgi:hypothetical protein
MERSLPALLRALAVPVLLAAALLAAIGLLIALVLL